MKNQEPSFLPAIRLAFLPIHPDPGAGCPVLVHHRPRVHIDPARGAGTELLDRLHQSFQFVAQNLVVVVARCVAGHDSRGRVVVGKGVGMIVVQRNRENSPGTLQDQARIEAFIHTPGHVLHFAVIIALQPGKKLFVGYVLDGRDPDPLETQIECFLFDSLGEESTEHLSKV